ncbi:hypothetical protein EIO60_03890|nr:hypothetical protein [Candidatus Pantoea persica]
MAHLLHEVSHLLTLLFRQCNTVEHVALRILRHTACRQSAMMHLVNRRRVCCFCAGVIRD